MIIANIFNALISIMGIFLGVGEAIVLRYKIISYGRNTEIVIPRHRCYIIILDSIEVQCR